VASVSQISEEHFLYNMVWDLANFKPTLNVVYILNDLLAEW
jgi:hypothetical protein